jgi:hypothetical protein
MALHRPKRFLMPVAVVAGTAILLYALDYFIARPIPNVDVSAAPEYANVIGKRFRTQQDLVAIGVTMDRNYKKQVDYITLVLPPGFSGPEVVTKERLQQGAVLEVMGVLKADSLLISRIDYVVRRRDVATASSAPITVRVVQDSKHNFGLDRAIYEPTE